MKACPFTSGLSNPFLLKPNSQINRGKNFKFKVLSITPEVPSLPHPRLSLTASGIYEASNLHKSYCFLSDPSEEETNLGAIDLDFSFSRFPTDQENSRPVDNLESRQRPPDFKKCKFCKNFHPSRVADRCSCDVNDNEMSGITQSEPECEGSKYQLEDDNLKLPTLYYLTADTHIEIENDNVLNNHLKESLDNSSNFSEQVRQSIENVHFDSPSLLSLTEKISSCLRIFREIGKG